MTRVLLLDSSFAAQPIHDWLISQSYKVWTIGNRLDDPLAQRDPDRHLQQDYSDVAAVQAHVDRLSIDYVVPGCTDLSIETALQLQFAGRTTLDTEQAHTTLGDKAAFRALCARLDLPAPRAIDPGTLPQNGQFIAKPVDAFSGRGITVFDGTDTGAAAQALAHAQDESRSGKALIETYAVGELHSYTAFIEGGRVALALLVHEAGSVTPYAVDTSYVCTDFPQAGQDQLQQALEKIATDLGLVDGLVHTQFIWDGQTPWIVEMSRRCPGDLYSMLIEHSTGTPYAARYASYFVENPLAAGPGDHRHILRHTITADHSVFEGVWFHTPVPMIHYVPLAPVGRPIPPAGKIDRVALMFAAYDSPTAREAARQQFLARRAYGVFPLARAD